MHLLAAIVIYSYQLFDMTAREVAKEDVVKHTIQRRGGFCSDGWCGPEVINRNIVVEFTHMTFGDVAARNVDAGLCFLWLRTIDVTWIPKSDHELIRRRDVQGLKHFKHLRHLDLSGQRHLRTRDLAVISEMQLESLNIAGTSVDDGVGDLLRNHKGLSSLFASNSYVGTGVLLPLSLNNLQLTLLDLHSDLTEPRSRQVDADLQQLRFLGKLESLSIGGRTVCGWGLSVLTNLPNLRVLSVTYCDITDDVVIDVIAKSKSLTALNLSNTSVSDRSMEAVAAMPRLGALFLSHTRVENEGVRVIAASKTITLVHADHTKVSIDAVVGNSKNGNGEPLRVFLGGK